MTTNDFSICRSGCEVTKQPKYHKKIMRKFCEKMYVIKVVFIF